MHIAGGRFVVTGGASLIGSHLTQQLLEAGAERSSCLTTMRSARPRWRRVWRRTGG